MSPPDIKKTSQRSKSLSVAALTARQYRNNKKAELEYLRSRLDSTLAELKQIKKLYCRSKLLLAELTVRLSLDNNLYMGNSVAAKPNYKDTYSDCASFVASEEADVFDKIEETHSLSEFLLSDYDPFINDCV